MLSKPLEGKLRLSRTQSNSEDDFFTLSLQDQKSGLEVIIGKIAMIEMGNLIAGMTTSITYEYNDNPEIGKKRERKSHKCYVPFAHRGRLSWKSDWDNFQDVVQVSLDNEGQGWTLCREKSFNSRKHDEDDTGTFYTFTVERYT